MTVPTSNDRAAHAGCTRTTPAWPNDVRTPDTRDDSRLRRWLLAVVLATGGAVATGALVACEPEPEPAANIATDSETDTAPDHGRRTAASNRIAETPEPDAEFENETQTGPGTGTEPETEPRTESPAARTAREADPRPAPADPNRRVRPALERIVDFYTIGGGSTNAERRMVGFVNERGGWTRFVETQVKPSVEWGVRRVWLHCPFGNTPNFRFDFDQRVLADEAGLDWLTRDFATVWKPVVEGSLGVPLEVVAYIGTVAAPREGRTPRDIEMNRLRDAGRADLWIDRALQSVKPALEAGMSIGFDAAADQPDRPPHNWSFAFASLLRSLGVQVYIEPRPQRSLPGWHDFDILIVDTFWSRSDPARHRDSQWAATNEQLTGEIILLIRVPPGVEGNRERIDELAERVRRHLRNGHSVAVPVRVFRNGGWTMERLLEGIDDDGPSRADQTRGDQTRDGERSRAR